jgi:hypothetical protein
MHHQQQGEKNYTLFIPHRKENLYTLGLDSNSNRIPLGSRGVVFQRAKEREAGAHGLHSVKE